LTSRERRLEVPLADVERAAFAAAACSPSLALLGDRRFEGSWGPLVGLAVRRAGRAWRVRQTADLLARVARRLETRRTAGGTFATGIAVALSYEALAEVEDPRPGPPVPRAAVL